MNSILKRVILCILLSPFLVIGVNNVNAATGWAFNVGTNGGSGEPNTDPDTSYVQDKLINMGYTSRRVTIPTFEELTRKIHSSRYFMESDLLFFAGHGNSMSMSWNYMKKGGIYKQAISNEDAGYTHLGSGYSFHGIGQYKLSKVKFAFFAGCETAKGFNSIAEYAFNKGAKISIGWQSTVNDSDALKWEKRFYDRLANGYTVSESISYANLGLYLNTSVKGIDYFGNKETTVNSVGNEAFSLADETYEQSKTYYFKSVAKEYPNLEIPTSIKTINSQFKLDDYIIESTSNKDGTIYDYYYTINGIKTNIGYTVFEDNYNNIKIVDNTTNYNLASLTKNHSKKIYDLEKKINQVSIREKALENSKIEYMDENKEIFNEYKYYNVDDNKLYYIVEVKVTDPTFGTYSIVTYKEEIK